MIDQQVRKFIRMSRFIMAVGACVPAAACAGSSHEGSNLVIRSAQASMHAMPLNIREGGPSLEAVTQGHVVVIDFFATWCEPCRESIPELNKLVDRHRKDGLRVVAVSIDAELDIVRDYVSGAGIGYPVYYDPDQTYAGRFGVRDVPMVLLLNDDGQVLHRARQVDDAAVVAVRAALRLP